MITNSGIGRNWRDVQKELLSPEEIQESEQRVAAMIELIEMKNKKSSTH
ncbi:hypothetical protein [Streptococcus pluranimalium]